MFICCLVIKIISVVTTYIFKDPLLETDMSYFQYFILWLSYIHIFFQVNFYGSFKVLSEHECFAHQ